MTFNIALSVFGFIAFIALDLSLLNRRTLLRGLVSIGACIALLTALLTTPAGSQILPADWHGDAVHIGYALISIAVVLLAYSIFVEIPLKQRSGRASENRHSQPSASEGDAQVAPKVVRTGTYALCRHPGYLWLCILMVGYILTEDNINAVLLAGMWSILNLLVVMIQDRFIFPKSFRDYPAYQVKTPFLIPTAASITSALRQAEVGD